jgi:nitrite reductase/ring-hydroxylating ferredoxin subunit
MGFIVRQGDRALGYVDQCPHAGWPLAAAPDRYLTRDGQRLFCGGHGAVFRIADGICVAGPCANQALEGWAVKVVDGVVLTAGGPGP